jgi:hypothetical protein
MNYNSIRYQVVNKNQDNVDWEKAARKLYNILDDIDTVDDLAKDNESLYCNLVRRHHKERFKLASTDGYDEFFHGGSK